MLEDVHRLAKVDTTIAFLHLQRNDCRVRCQRVVILGYIELQSRGGLCDGGKQPDARDARKGICTVVGVDVSQETYFKTWVMKRDTVTLRSSAIATLPDSPYYSLPSRRREDRYHLCFYYA